MKTLLLVGLLVVVAERPAWAQGAPTLEELRNATYAGLDVPTGTVTLRDGHWEQRPEPARPPRVVIDVARDLRLVGDLDGDGVDEAVVVLSRQSGGSGSVSYLAVVKRQAGTLQNVATTALGDRVQIRSARIEGGRVLVSAVRAGPQDAACCPGELVDLGWTLNAGRLSPFTVVSASNARLSLDTLVGGEWVLRAWDFNEPASPEHPATLSYESARFSGSGGCNRYFAGVTAGNMPGDISVSPVGSTRMACGEASDRAEGRFLAQLGAAQKFGFMLGQLAVTYKKSDGSFGTMLFDGQARQAPR
jgi:heat shock protein HslJ